MLNLRLRELRQYSHNRLRVSILAMRGFADDAVESHKAGADEDRQLGLLSQRQAQLDRRHAVRWLQVGRDAKEARSDESPALRVEQQAD